MSDSELTEVKCAVQSCWLAYSPSGAQVVRISSVIYASDDPKLIGKRAEGGLQITRPNGTASRANLAVIDACGIEPYTSGQRIRAGVRRDEVVPALKSIMPITQATTDKETGQ